MDGYIEYRQIERAGKSRYGGSGGRDGGRLEGKGDEGCRARL